MRSINQRCFDTGKHKSDALLRLQHQSVSKDMLDSQLVMVEIGLRKEVNNVIIS